MKKLVLFTAILMLVLCALLLIGCDEESPAPAAVEIPSASELGKGIQLSAYPSVNYYGTTAPTLDISYNYNEFDFAACTNLQLQVCYKDNVLATREMATLPSHVLLEACYGRVTVRVTGQTADGNTVVLKEGIVPVSAPEYNVASLNGSMPVLYFSLDLFSRDTYGATHTGYTQSALPVMKDVPTFIALERVDSYDWDALPDYVYSFPALSEPTGDFFINNNVMIEYVRELYEINPDSRFNLYCVDNYPELILQCFVAQELRTTTSL